MYISELIIKLQEMQEMYGDKPIWFSTGTHTAGNAKIQNNSTSKDYEILLDD